MKIIPETHILDCGYIKTYHVLYPSIFKLL